MNTISCNVLDLEEKIVIYLLKVNLLKTQDQI